MNQYHHAEKVYIQQIINELKIPFFLVYKACKVIDNIRKNSWILQGKHPRVTAAATVWILTKKNGMDAILQQDIARIMNISTNSIHSRTRLLEKEIHRNETTKFVNRVKEIRKEAYTYV